MKRRSWGSVVGLMAVVLAWALVGAMLRAAGEDWFRLAYSITVVVLLMTVLLARQRREPERSFWFGFAALGWGYFLIALNPLTESHSDPWATPVHVNRSLVTTDWFTLLADRIVGRAEGNLADDHYYRGGLLTVVRVEKRVYNTVCMLHLLTAYTAGLCGGAASLALRPRPGDER